MTVKEYLEELPNMRMRIRAMERKIQECEERASDTSAKLTDEHGSGGVMKFGKANIDFLTGWYGAPDGEDYEPEEADDEGR